MTRYGILAALIICGSATAALAGEGRLLATGGATTLEGAAGGGIVPWAVLTGYGAENQQSGSAFITRVDTGDYSLNSVGAAWSWHNRVELSFARQTLDIGTLGITVLPSLLGVPPTTFDDSVLRQDVLGAKVRVAGDVVYGALPQVSVGLQYKQADDMTIPTTVGALRDNDTDVYVAASKVLLGGAFGNNLLLNGTLRATRANETGLLGFGGPNNDDHELVAEAAVAVLTDDRTAIGFEYRQKPDNLAMTKECDWQDVFIAWFPSKKMSLVMAWANLRSVATLENQEGLYLSAQAAF